jgi:hypothetical protein
MANQYTKNSKKRYNKRSGVTVSGYTRKDGTRVTGYNRSSPSR